MNTAPREPNPRPTNRKPGRLYAHSWTTAAGLAALALTVLETAGTQHP